MYNQTSQESSDFNQEKFNKENEDIVEKYIQWLNNDGILTAGEVYKIVEDIIKGE